MSRAPFRAALLAAALLAALPALAAPRGGVSVDVSPLVRSGNVVSADYLAHVLPGYLTEAFGPGHSVSVRIDDIAFGFGGVGRRLSSGAIDYIAGVAVIDGRTVPLQCSLVARVTDIDVGGYSGRLRQDNLARAFVQWLPRQANW